MSLFSIGEPLVCLHADGKPYAAKVLAIKKNRYVIHYQGWNARHDEKVEVGKEAGKLFKGNVSDYCRQRGIPVPEHKSRQRAKERRSVEEEEAGPAPPPPVEPVLNVTAQLRRLRFENHAMQPIKLTESLLELWNRDKALVIHPQEPRIPVAPAAVTVDHIVQEYQESLKSSQEINEVQATRLKLYSNGVVDYFNHCLPRYLIHPSERPTYEKIVTEVLRDKGQPLNDLYNIDERCFKPSTKYGLIHLVRLIPMIHVIANSQNWPTQRDVEETKKGVEAFIAYLETHKERFDVGQNGYKPASED